MLEILLRWATGNLPFNRDKNFRPSMVYRLMTDPFGVWCDYHAPQEEAVEEVSRYENLRKQLGLEYEESWIRENYPEAVKVKPEFGLEALRNTLQAMLNGVPAIQGPQLWLLPDEIYGRADLLVRSNEAASDLGPYHYRLREIKRSNNLQPHHSLQAVLYNRMLGHIQAYIPNEITIVLRDDEDVIHYQSLEVEVDELLSKWRQIRDGRLKPEPAGMDKSLSPWRQYANRLLREQMDFTLLADVGPSGQDKLRKRLGIERITVFFRSGESQRGMR
ncbi:hypothetical protein LR013_05135 [candidate division NPL-UPA2 bacterium]|nr:hypothetical protein [candidate division NPL-UPA2 bacterium]